MWSRQLFIVWFFALIILATQSHVIHKRGLISKAFGGSSKSTRNVEQDLSPKERSKFRELLKNPIVIATLTAAVGMVVQKALASRNINDVCENKYIKMAYLAANINPQLQQAIALLGCNANNRQKSSSSAPGNRISTTTTGFSENENNNDDDEEEEAEETDGGKLESALPPEKESRIKQLLSISHGEKGAKRNFLKGLFGLKKKEKAFKQGHKLPSSSYKLDKDDANALTDLEKELEQYKKTIN